MPDDDAGIEAEFLDHVTAFLWSSSDATAEARLHDMLTGLASDSANNFSFIDTRNTLTRDATQPNGWANEIDPWYPGFTALANSFLVGLQAMPAFKNRI